jgi:hypothetical protein
MTQEELIASVRRWAFGTRPETTRLALSLTYFDGHLSVKAGHLTPTNVAEVAHWPASA